MTGRSGRALIAQETIRIVKNGYYTAPNGDRIDIDTAAKSAVENTILYRPSDFAGVHTNCQAKIRELGAGNANTNLRVTNQTTFAACRDLLAKSPKSRVACLNFASAKNPGGGFLSGAQAQEECLARGSALYSCINPIREYYEANRTNRSSLYLEHMIYSPDVPVFRDDDDRLLDVAYNASIITSPAVNAGAVRKNERHKIDQIESVMRGRIRNVLAVAVINQQRDIVLGAWGCGVFRNSCSDIARWFRDELDGDFAGAFANVTFAVLDTTREKRFITPFEEVFTVEVGEARYESN